MISQPRAARSSIRLRWTPLDDGSWHLHDSGGHDNRLLAVYGLHIRLAFAHLPDGSATSRKPTTQALVSTLT